MQGDLLNSLTEHATSWRVMRDIKAKFSPDGQTILTYGPHGVRLWNRDGTPRGKLGPQFLANSAEFGADGKSIFVSSEDILRIYDFDGRPQGAVYSDEYYLRGIQSEIGRAHV